MVANSAHLAVSALQCTAGPPRYCNRKEAKLEGASLFRFSTCVTIGTS